MEKLNGLTQAQWDELCDFITAAMHNVVAEKADASLVVRNHQQSLVMFEEVRNAILLI